MRRAAATAVAAALLAWAPPAPAQVPQLPGPCRANSSKINQPDALAPLVVGDSVTVAAGRDLARAGFTVDAIACRMWVHGLAVLSRRRLPDLVIVALGSNGDTKPADLNRALDLVGPFARLVLVVPKDLGGKVDPDGRVMRAFQDLHPDQVSLLDWPTYSAGHGEWFAPDGLHLTSAGAAGFAQMIAEGVEFAPAESVEPPGDEPPPERPQRPRPRPRPKPPALSGLWRDFGVAVAGVLRPPLRLLGRAFAPAGGVGAPQDL